MQEIEIEILVDSFSEIRSGLLNGLSPEKISSYRDIYFGEELLRKGKRLRLRRIDNNHCVLTFKSPKIEGAIQKSEEIEVILSDFDSAFLILKNLFGEPYFDERLKVESYHIDEVVVDLREVVGLFRYVEIEGPEEKILKISKNVNGSPMKKGAFSQVMALRND